MFSAGLVPAFSFPQNHLIGNKQFKDMTGIEVKKRRTYKKKAAAPAVVYAGDKAPTENTKGYVTVPVVIAGFSIYYEVDKDLAADMAEKGVSLQDKGGSVKSENEIYMELYGYNPDKHNYDETRDAILADQEAFTAKYGEAAFWTVSTTARYGSLATAYAPFADSQYYDPMATLNDLYTNQETYINELGANEYFRQLEAAFETAESYYFDKLGYSAKSYQESIEGEEAISFSSIREAFPQYLGGYEYSEANAFDVQNKNNDLPPQSFDMDAVTAKLTLPSWYEKPEVWDWDSLIDAMCVSAFMEWSYSMKIDLGTIDELPESEFIQLFPSESIRQGALIYYNQTPGTIAQYESVIAAAESIPDIYDSPEANALEAQLRYDRSTWEDLTLAEQAYYAAQKIENYRPALIEQGQAYAQKHGKNGTEISDEAAATLGLLLQQDETIADEQTRTGHADEKKVEINGVGYIWSPSEGITNAWITEEACAELNIATAGDLQVEANEAIKNILYKKYMGEVVTEEDYAVLYQYGMNDITQYLKDMGIVEYDDLPESSRDQVKDVIMQNGYYESFDFTPEELEFLKAATVGMIDQRIAEESVKAEPDEQMLAALNLYRYYKDDLRMEVTGDYEADRTAAKKIWEENLCAITGAQNFDEVKNWVTNAYSNPEAIAKGEVVIPECIQEAYRILAAAPPELFCRTAEEVQMGLNSWEAAVIGGIRNGATLGLTSLIKENVANAELFKRMALSGNPIGGSEFYRNGRFYNMSVTDEDAILAANNPWAYTIGNFAGSLPMTIATGGIAGSIAEGFNLSTAAVKAIGGAVPAAIRSGISTAGAGGDAGDIILNAVVDGAFAAVSFGTLGTATEAAVGSLLSEAPALLQMTIPALSSATVTTIANTGLNLLSDVVTGRETDWSQTFANMGVDFLFSLFLNGKSGDNAYLDPATGKNIDVPEGKALADIDPEIARFYNALGDTKVTGELHTAIGDMYTSYLDIPESIITRSDFKPLETAYRNYEANATVKNAAAFLDEAGKVYARAEDSGYKVGNPYDTINAAIEADFAARQGVAGDIGRSATDIGATATDIGGSVTDIGATAKAYVDTTNGVGDNEDNNGLLKIDTSILAKDKRTMTADDFITLREVAKQLQATPENAVKIGSEKTWKEFIAHNPSKDLRKSAEAYIKLIVDTNPWPDGYRPQTKILPAGSTINMVMSVGQPDTSPGGWATIDGINNVVNNAREHLAITAEFKSDIDRINIYEIIKDLPVKEGPVGPQIDIIADVYLPGGGTQEYIDIPRKLRNKYLIKIGEIKLT